MFVLSEELGMNIILRLFVPAPNTSNEKVAHAVQTVYTARGQPKTWIYGNIYTTQALVIMQNV